MTASAGVEQGAMRRIVRNAISILAGNTVGELLTGYALVLAAGSLGPASFGRLSAAQAFIEPFDALAGFGLAHLAMRFSAAAGAPTGAIRGTVLGLRGGLALIAAPLALCAAWLSGRGDLLPVLLLLTVNTLTTPIVAAATLPYDFHQAAHKRIYLPTVVAIVRVGTALVAARTLATPLGFQLSGTITGLFSVTLTILLARRHYPEKYSFDRGLAKEALALGWAAAVTDVVALTYLRGPYLLLHDDAVQLGLFAGADRLVRPVLTVSTYFVVSGLPTIARMVQAHEYDALLSALFRVTSRAFLVGIPVIAACCFAVPWVLGRFAPSYVGSVAPFRVLALATLMVMVTQVAYVYIMALGKTRAIMAIATVNFFVYFGVAHVLVPTRGAYGAAIATAVMEGINVFLQLGLVVVILRGLARDYASKGGGRPSVRA